MMCARRERSPSDRACRCRNGTDKYSKSEWPLFWSLCHFRERVESHERSGQCASLIGTVPLGAWETITFVAALRHNKMTAPMVVEGAMTGEMFLAYIEQCLVPTLRRNDIVVMDNCRVHMGPAIREAIEKAHATLRYLPKYSPDLNPIELPYSKFKAFLR